MKADHDFAKKYECRICHKTLTCSFNLTWHYKYIHPGQEVNAQRQPITEKIDKVQNNFTDKHADATPL
jgi:hypothetical protein